MCAFVTEGLGVGSIWGGRRHQVFLGNDGFIERFAQPARALDRLREVPRPLARPLGHYARPFDHRDPFPGDAGLRFELDQALADEFAEVTELQRMIAESG